MVFSLDRAQTQKKQVRKLFKAKVNSKNGGSRLDWKKDYTPRENDGTYLFRNLSLKCGKIDKII